MLSLMYTPTSPPLLLRSYLSKVYPLISTIDVGAVFCKIVSVTPNILIVFSKIKSSKYLFYLQVTNILVKDGKITCISAY